MPRPATGEVLERDGKRGTAYVLRFRAYGKRQWITLGNTGDGWTRQRAETELQNVLADVRRGRWQPPAPEPSALPPRDPTFHEFASQWFEAQRGALRPNTILDYEWQLTHHLLPFFSRHRLSQISVAEVDRYRHAKVRVGTLSATSINKTITRLGQILEVAVEYEMLDRNPAKGKNRRVKASAKRRPWLDREEQIGALLKAAGELDREARRDRRGVARRPLLATLTFAGLRVGELCALRWRDVDLAGGRIKVGESKTDAGVRHVKLLPVLRDELATHKASSRRIASSDPVFPTLTGRPRDKDNVRNRVLAPAVKRADELLDAAGSVPLPEGLTPHGLRHTFASLLVALGEDPRYVMGQLGHTDPAFTLRLYSHAMRRDEGDLDQLRALAGLEPADSMGAFGSKSASSAAA